MSHIIDCDRLHAFLNGLDIKCNLTNKNKIAINVTLTPYMMLPTFLSKEILFLTKKKLKYNTIWPLEFQKYLVTNNLSGLEFVSIRKILNRSLRP